MLPRDASTTVDDSGDAFDGSRMDGLGERADDQIGNLRALRKPHLFVISGPSGVGKDAVIERLRGRFPDVYFAVTATTRERRPGEIDGVHYFFLDKPTFLLRQGEGEFLESAVVYGSHYGTPRSPIRQALDRGQDVIVKVDVQGSESIRRLVPEASLVFLAPESMTELLHRLRSRKTDDPDALMRRFGTASREIGTALSFDFVIFNEADRLDQTLDQISAVVNSERSRVRQHMIEL